jgi:DNA-binding transcriptional LysR family regulator
MDNRAGEMMVFVWVVEAGNFSEAARLGIRLIERSTRRLTLTKEGQFYYERSQVLLGQLQSFLAGE